MQSPRFSANLGFLWADLPLPDAIRAAHAAGFDAVECHFPYAHAPDAVRAALHDTGLAMIALNTAPGDRARGEFGIAALPGRAAEARAGIDAALAFAGAVGCGMVHVMAGVTDAAGAEAAFCANLAHAAQAAALRGLTVLIEPLNPRDVPGYFLTDLDQAARIITSVGAPNLRVMFDCYHQQITGGDLVTRFARHLAVIGHVQIAAVPDRGEPDRGEVDFRWLIPQLRRLGYAGAFGAEYRPRGTVQAGLGWLATLRG